MTDKLFSIVGVSLHNNQWKVRWANDLVTRFKMLHKGGHENIELFETPQPMSKPEATKWLTQHTKFEDLCEDARYAVTSKLEEYGHFRSTVKISMDDIKSRPVIDTPEPTPVQEVDDIPAGETVLIKPAQPTE